MTPIQPPTAAGAVKRDPPRYKEKKTKKKRNKSPPSRKQFDEFLRERL